MVEEVEKVEKVEAPQRLRQCPCQKRCGASTPQLLNFLSTIKLFSRFIVISCYEYDIKKSQAG